VLIATHDPQLIQKWRNRSLALDHGRLH